MWMRRVIELSEYVSCIARSDERESLGVGIFRKGRGRSDGREMRDM